MPFGIKRLLLGMDAFYASVELRSRPELQGLPVIVGGAGNRGVVLSATYEARAYGVRSAMPMVRARRLCPAAIVLPPSFSHYTEASAGIMEIFRSVSPLVEPLSLDEAFIDVRGAVRRLGRPRDIAAWIRARIWDEQELPCTVGVAPSKFVAKLASAHGKPDGLLVVPAAQIVAFLHPLPVEALWGVGEKTGAVLNRLGLRTVGDLAQVSVETLQRALGPAAGAHLSALSWGRDDRPVIASEPDKSIGHEETFSRDIDDPEVVLREVLRLAERTAARLREQGYAARTITLKVRFSDFTTLTRSRTLPQVTDSGQEIYEIGRELFRKLGLQRARLRLVGIRAESLTPTGKATRQLMMGDRESGWREADRAVDRAAARFGSGSIQPATLVDPPGRSRPVRR